MMPYRRESTPFSALGNVCYSFHSLCRSFDNNNEGSTSAEPGSAEAVDYYTTTGKPLASVTEPSTYLVEPLTRAIANQRRPSRELRFALADLRGPITAGISH